MPLRDKLKPRISPLPQGAGNNRLAVMIATWFGVGRLRPAPGTLGTLAAVPFGFVIMALGGPLALLACTVLLFFVGAKAAGVYGRLSGTKDDQSIVVDEVIGLWIAALPAAFVPGLWILAFVLFRFFDIYKPWPASYFDRRQKNDYDVLLDDVIAGIFALGGVAFVALQIPA